MSISLLSSAPAVAAASTCLTGPLLMTASTADRDISLPRPSLLLPLHR